MIGSTMRWGSVTFQVIDASETRTVSGYPVAAISIALGIAVGVYCLWTMTEHQLLKPVWTILPGIIIVIIAIAGSNAANNRVASNYPLRDQMAACADGCSTSRHFGAGPWLTVIGGILICLIMLLLWLPYHGGRNNTAPQPSQGSPHSTSVQIPMATPKFPRAATPFRHWLDSLRGGGAVRYAVIFAVAGLGLAFVNTTMILPVGGLLTLMSFGCFIMTLFIAGVALFRNAPHE